MHKRQIWGFERPLAKVNVSPFPAIESRTYHRGAARNAASTPAEERFFFGFDTGPYWFAPLGRCFDLSEHDIGGRAAVVIGQDWQYPGHLHWDEDERTRRKILKHEETGHSHGSYPAADELRFYLSYHAMMVVAGQLLATMPTYRDPDHSEDDFSNWLHSRHDLSRRDGYWLADRRDPIPIDTRSWTQEVQGNDWRSLVRRRDLDRTLSPSTGMLTLWGTWTAVSGRREQMCNIRSALVSPSRSQALLRALQSADDPHDFIVPNADDDRQIEFGPFCLKDWITDRSRDSGVDSKDPWAGRIAYPAPAFSPEIAAAMNLNTDREHRTWRQGQHNEAVVTAATWETFWDKDAEGSEEQGDRVQATPPFIRELLRTLDMDMIVSVEIQRGHGYRRCESRSDDEKSRFRQARASSSSKPTAASEPSDPVLALGKKLIRELELGNTTDTLSRWVVHHIAGLIKTAEQQPAKNRAAADKECFDTILALWQHRHELPDGKRSFQDVEPVLRALESLDPANTERRYFPSALPPPGNTKESKETRSWLELAEGLDNSARILIRRCLTNAAAAAIDKSKDWVALAESAGRKDVDLPLLKIIIGERRLKGTSDPDEMQRKIASVSCAHSSRLPRPLPSTMSDRSKARSPYVSRKQLSNLVLRNHLT